MAITTKSVEYTDADTLLEGYLAWDDRSSEPRPVVLIAHAWSGRDGFVCNQAKRIAELGFAGFALDMYGKGVLGSSPEENTNLMTPFLEDRAMLQQRMQAALQAAGAEAVVDATRVAAMGYCFGGLCVLDLARIGADVRGVISNHGLLVPPPNLGRQEIKAKVLALHGYADPMVLPDAVRGFAIEMTEAKADWQIHAYGHTYHSFTDPSANSPEMGIMYNATAEARAWVAAVNFLGELFG